MKYEVGTFDPNLRVPIPTVFDRIVWLIVGYWFNILGPLFVWLRWRKKNSFICAAGSTGWIYARIRSMCM